MTTDLFIIRHAIAHEHDTGRWPDDADRPLTQDGVGAFRKAARGVRALGLTAESHWSSPAVRAWDTAAILTDEAGWPTAEAIEALAPDRPPGGIVAALREQASSTPIAIVGHEPTLSRTIEILTGARVQMKKGALARLQISAFAPGGATLRALLPPRVLRAAG